MKQKGIFPNGLRSILEWVENEIDVRSKLEMGEPTLGLLVFDRA